MFDIDTESVWLAEKQLFFTPDGKNWVVKEMSCPFDHVL